VGAGGVAVAGGGVALGTLRRPGTH
jgi:hypothetical protein